LLFSEILPPFLEELDNLSAEVARLRLALADAPSRQDFDEVRRRLADCEVNCRSVLTLLGEDAGGPTPDFQAARGRGRPPGPGRA
jgi:hypothetical protein